MLYQKYPVVLVKFHRKCKQGDKENKRKYFVKIQNASLKIFGSFSLSTFPNDISSDSLTFFISADVFCLFILWLYSST